MTAGQPATATLALGVRSVGVTIPAAPHTVLIRLGQGARERFGLLLLILVVSYLISAFTTGSVVSTIQIVLFVAVALLALRSEGFGRRSAVLAIAVAVPGSTAAIVLTQIHATANVGAGVVSAWTALILLYSAVLIVRRVLMQPDVTVQSIYGAISAYMIIGLMFAAVYGAMYRFGGNTFFAQTATGSSKKLQYFSFSTLTTLGYGDFTPAGSGGQAVAVVEAMVGQIFLATLVARLVAAYRSPRQSPPHEDERPAQAPAPQHGPGQRRPPSARRWRPPPPTGGPRLAASRRQARKRQ
jgi:Ion channel